MRKAGVIDAFIIVVNRGIFVYFKERKLSGINCGSSLLTTLSN